MRCYLEPLEPVRDAADNAQHGKYEKVVFKRKLSHSFSPVEDELSPSIVHLNYIFVNMSNNACIVGCLSKVEPCSSLTKRKRGGVIRVLLLPVTAVCPQFRAFAAFALTAFA